MGFVAWCSWPVVAMWSAVENPVIITYQAI